ncbi:MAG: hypothetical protein Q8M31_19725 [Beijerinckiaceae bacterium]|nr:hypothetical protein [Beijerinckiaceae bacterium]
MSDGWYVLDETDEPVPATELEFSAWKRANPDRCRVGEYEVGNAVVSTVFLGRDQGYAESEHVLWQTLVSGGPLDGECDRYTSHEAAKRGHESWSTRVYLCAIAD